jgi:hypothetical protein
MNPITNKGKVQASKESKDSARAEFVEATTLAHPVVADPENKRVTKFREGAIESFQNMVKRNVPFIAELEKASTTLLEKVQSNPRMPNAEKRALRSTATKLENRAVYARGLEKQQDTIQGVLGGWDRIEDTKHSYVRAIYRALSDEYTKRNPHKLLRFAPAMEAALALAADDDSLSASEHASNKCDQWEALAAQKKS